MSAKISILGLGIPGAAMVRSAAHGGLNTTSWDRSPERASSFASDKIQIAQCGWDAVQDADIVVTMVSNAHAVLFNAWMAVLMEGVAEVSILGDALGIDLGRFASLVSGGPLVPAWAVAKWQKIKEGRTVETEFPLRWAHKDVQLALAAAGGERARPPILIKIDATWTEAEPGFGAHELSAIYTALSNGVKR